MTQIASLSAAPSAVENRRVYRILVADNHRIFREALGFLVAAEGEFAVVGESGKASETLRLIATLQPDVVVTDIQLADGPSVKLIEDIHAHFPKVAVLVLTAVRARDLITAAKKAGALGYVLKDRGRGELIAALRRVAAGRAYRSIGRANPLHASSDEGSQLSTRAAYLTERQRMVLRSVALGHGTREIAATLGLTVRAVHKQRERLRNLLELNSTAALTRFAVSGGFAEEVLPDR